MRTDEEEFYLPADPMEAFLFLERQFRSIYITGGKNEADYVSAVTAAKDQLCLNILEQWDGKPYDNIYGFLFKRFETDVNYVKTRFSIARATKLTINSAGLDHDTKNEIRNYLSKIKSIIDNASSDDRKRENLYAKISDLENEVDRDRTKFEAYGALVIEVAGVAGDAAKKLEPVRKFLDSIAKLLGLAKSHEDAHRQLPSPPKPQQLNPPDSTLERSTDIIEDDIPF